jgi:TonB-linked SusC/RagA family outer membrane protein
MKKCLLIFTMLCFAAGYLLAQTEITGKVTDVSGSPIPGVNVIIKGTDTGTITNADGNYTIYNVPADATLVFSFVGMLTEEIEVGSKTEINTTLAEDILSLDEVVVIGYGSIKRKDLTGAVASVKSEDIIKAPTHNAIEAIQGLVPGMDITRQSGAAGSGVDIRIRGNRSLDASNDPLFIIDGMQGGSISDINPNDIESIEVLKDASSTAIYGYQGANGVIIITTKKGSRDKTKVVYNGYYGVNGLTPYPSGRLRDDYIEFRRQAYIGEGGEWNSPDDDEKMFNSYEWDAIQNDQWVNWNNLLIEDGYIQNHQISVSGGNEKTVSLLSASLYKEKGSINDDYSRYNIRLNLDHNISKWIKTGVITQITHSERNRIKDPFSKANSSTPLGTPYNEYDQIVIYPFPGDNSTVSPLTDLRENAAINNQEATRISSIGYVEIFPIRGLSFRSNLGINLNNQRDGVFNDSASMSQFNLKYNQASVSQSNNRYINWDNIFTYTKEIGNHSFIITALTSYTQNKSEDFYAMGIRQPLPVQWFYNLSSTEATSTQISSSYVESETMSYAGRIHYSFKNRYLLTLTERFDGASMLSEGHKWDQFPSAAIAWRISEENFMKAIDVISNLKLRISRGLTGNSNIDPYGTQSAVVVSNNMSFGEVPAQTYSFSKFIANANVGWEKSDMTDIGLDVGLFQNRVSMVFDMYKTKTTDILMSRSLPWSAGGTSSSNPELFETWQNIGSTENKGIEISLNTENVRTSGFRWSSDLTFMANREKITGLVSDLDTMIIGSSEENTLIVGQPRSAIFTFEKIGIWQIEDTEELAAMKTPFELGEIKLSDLNNDSIIDDLDRTVIGSKVPKWSMGIKNNFMYKSFDLSVYLFFRYGQMINNELLARYNPSGEGNGPAYIDYWTPDNPTNDFPRPGINGKLNEYLGYQSLYYVDGSYFKIKNITLGYTLPKSISNRLFIENLRVYGTVSNILTIARSHLVKYYDPENGGSEKAPMSKQIIFGINLEF